MGGSGWVWRVWNFMTQTQPNPLSKKILQPNPTHQALKTDQIRQVGLGWVGLGRFWWVGRLAAHP